MIFGRVAGSVVATRRSDRVEGPKFLLVELTDLHDLTYVSFTIEDSFTSYRDVLMRRGLRSLSKKKQTMRRVPDHGRLFGIDDLNSVFRRYEHECGLMFEVQIWDHEIWQIGNAGMPHRLSGLESSNFRYPS